MLKREAVFTAKIPVAVFAMERKVHMLPAEGTVRIDRGFFFPNSVEKKVTISARIPTNLLLPSRVKNIEPGMYLGNWIIGDETGWGRHEPAGEHTTGP